MSIEGAVVETPDGVVSYSVVVCDQCGTRVVRETCGSDWLAVFGSRSERHFCTEKCLAGYMIGLTVVEGVEA